MIILDTTPLLTREVSIDYAASEIRFVSLQLAHGIGTILEKNMLKVSKLSFEKESLF